MAEAHDVPPEAAQRGDPGWHPIDCPKCDGGRSREVVAPLPSTSTLMESLGRARAAVIGAGEHHRRAARENTNTDRRLTEQRQGDAVLDEAREHINDAIRTAAAMAEAQERIAALEGALAFIEGETAVLVNTSVAPEIGAWRDSFVAAHRRAAAYLHEREHGAAPEAAVRHARRADERAKGAVQWLRKFL